jgi:hypothetical protein
MPLVRVLFDFRGSNTLAIMFGRCSGGHDRVVMRVGTRNNKLGE